jgi:hypothetical protein
MIKLSQYYNSFCLKTGVVFAYLRKIKNKKDGIVFPAFSLFFIFFQSSSICSRP